MNVKMEMYQTEAAVRSVTTSQVVLTALAKRDSFLPRMEDFAVSCNNKKSF